LRQVHGTAVFDADTGAVDGTSLPLDGDEPEADAAVTRCPGVVLAVLHADCLPVLLCSDDGAVLGAAHAGWRGLAAGVVEATIDAMRVPGERVMAWLGPAAGPTNYEVGDEVRAAFVDGDAGAAAAFVATRPEHWRVDLYALARRRLARLGVARVHGGGRCTIGEPNAFFSHRRDARTGRMASLIWRVS
jgi:YfiH family protein